LLCRLYGRMSPDQQRDFWQLRGTKIEKLAYLLRWGTFKQVEGEANEDIA